MKQENSFIYKTNKSDRQNVSTSDLRSFSFTKEKKIICFQTKQKKMQTIQHTPVHTQV